MKKHYWPQTFEVYISNEQSKTVMKHVCIAEPDFWLSEYSLIQLCLTNRLFWFLKSVIDNTNKHGGSDWNWWFKQILLFLCILFISQRVTELWVVCGLSELKTKCFVSMWVNVSVNVQVRWVALVRTCLPWIYGWLYSCLGMCVWGCVSELCLYVRVTFIIQHISVWASTGLLQSWIWCDIMRAEGSWTQRCFDLHYTTVFITEEENDCNMGSLVGHLRCQKLLELSQNAFCPSPKPWQEHYIIIQNNPSLAQKLQIDMN